MTQPIAPERYAVAVDQAAEKIGGNSILLSVKPFPPKMMTNAPGLLSVAAITYWGMPGMYVITSSLSLARELWRHGEPELAGRALLVSPEQVAEIGRRAGQLHTSGDAARLWPDGPSGKIVLLAAIEQLEGCQFRGEL